MSEHTNGDLPMNANLISEVHDHPPLRKPAKAAAAFVPVVDPPDGAGPSGDEHSTLGLVELLLKNPVRADALNREENQQAVLIPRFLSIALASYVLFSVAMILILSSTSESARPHRFLPIPVVQWSNRSALGLLIAYNFGLVAATCICLPSFYFFALLAGVRMSMVQIVGQVLRCKASSAIVLVGILPIYVAVVLGMAVFHIAPGILELVLYVGLALPFIAGLEGVRSIYRGVMGMAETLPAERRCRRACFLRRLTLSWAAVYTAVSPVLIYRLWVFLAGQLS
jgi:hypothetical protein